MPVKLNITAKDLIFNATKDLFGSVKEATDIVYEEIRAESPVDTGDYKAGNKNLGVRREGTKVIGTIINDDEKAEEVEFGFGVIAVNRHPEGRPVYTNVGARVYNRTKTKLEKQVINKIRKDIGT